jgi:RHS repeat-associated protein
MKTLLRQAAAVVSGFSLLAGPSQSARATITVNSTNSFGSVSISPASGSLQYLSPLQDSAYGQAGANTQYNTSIPGFAGAGDTPAPGTFINGFAQVSAALFNGSSSAQGFIPGTVAAFDTSTGRAAVSGQFEITGATGPVSVTFSATVKQLLSLSSDVYGVQGEGENVFSFSLNGTPILFNDQLLTIGPSQTANGNFNQTLTVSEMINPNTPYSLWVEGDAEMQVLNSTTAVPEPGPVALLAEGILAFGLAGWARRRRALKKALFAGALAGLATTVHAMYLGSDAPDICKTCGAQPTRQTAGDIQPSLTEGNLRDDYPVVTLRSGFGPALSFGCTYNSYNADGSKSQMDVGMGYGWTHTFSSLLFSQRGQMFRLGPDGRVTQYIPSPSGPPGSYVSDSGYFETMNRQPDGTFYVTNKNHGWWHFGAVSNTHFMVQGPVYRLLQMGDRNQNVSTMTYDTNGQLSTAADPYGRTIQFTYNSSNKLSTVTDPLGRTTTYQYDPQYREPTQITDPSGNITRYTYNAQYQMTQKIDRDGRTYFYTYKYDRPFMVTDGTGLPYLSMSNSNAWAVNSTNLAYSLHRQYVPSTTSRTDGRGNVWQYSYDTNGYVTQTVGPDGATTRYSYDPALHEITQVTDPLGRVTTYSYDAEGNRTQMTDPMGNTTTYTYEPVFNMITSTTDPLGRTTTYSYDASGNKIQETDPLLHSETWTYDPHGNMLSHTDKNTNTTTYTYDGFGNRLTMTDPVLNTTHYQYDIDGNLIQTVDPLGNSTRYQYDALDRVITISNALGGVTRYGYDGMSRQTSVTDPNTNITSYQYDQRGRMVQMTDATGHTMQYGYDGNDNRITLTNRLGNVATYGYDTENRMIATTNPLLGVTRYTYDLDGNRLTTTDPNTNTTDYGYDDLNRVISTTNALGGVTRYQYSMPGGPPCCSASPGSSLITEMQDADGNITYYHYDELDRRVQVLRKNSDTNNVINPTDAVTTTTYDAVGNIVAVTDANGNTTTTTYDADNRSIQTVNPVGEITRTAYDADGNVLDVTAPNGNITTNGYDALNRVVTVYDALGLVRTTAYDADGNVTSTTDPLGNTTRTAYDALNRVITTTDPLGQTSITAYDADGDVISQTDRNGHVTTYMYDALDRRIERIDPLGNTTTTAYDADGNVLSLTDPNGHVTTYTYDALNRRITETYPDSAPNTRTNSYDAVGNLIQLGDQMGRITTYQYDDLYRLTNRAYSPSGSVDRFTYDDGGRILSSDRNGWTDTYSYDGADRVIGATENGRTFSYSYNTAGRTQTNTQPSGRTITFAYDARDRLITERDGTPNPPIVDYTYDGADRVVTRAYRNGTTAYYTYNADGWITSLNHSNGPTLIAGFNYTYDNEGNKLYEQKNDSPAHSETYNYDALDRLTNYEVGTLVGPTIPSPALTKVWDLDPVGNWLNLISNSIPDIRTYGPANELLTDNGSNYVYDAVGNLVRDNSYNYGYDEENRLIRVQRLSDLAIVGQYTYDAIGRRVTRIANPAGSPTTNLYFYDGPRVNEEQDSTGATTAMYCYGNYIDEALTMDRGGQTYYYHHNALWSPYALTIGSGSVAERYTYDAYGEVTVLDPSYNPVPFNAWATPHSAVTNIWLFTGRQLDEEAGLYNYRARYYDSLKGRFDERDPIDYLGGINLYQYVSSRPTVKTDPHGLVIDPITVTIVATGVTLAAGAITTYYATGCDYGSERVATYQLDCYRTCSRSVFKTRWKIFGGNYWTRETYYTYGQTQKKRTEVCGRNCIGRATFYRSIGANGNWDTTVPCTAPACNRGDREDGLHFYEP